MFEHADDGLGLEQIAVICQRAFEDTVSLPYAQRQVDSRDNLIGTCEFDIAPVRRGARPVCHLLRGTRRRHRRALFPSEPHLKERPTILVTYWLQMLDQS